MKKAAAQPLLIKKYENRRLYNTLTSQYIIRTRWRNWCATAATAGGGRHHRRGRDRLILAQIVVEDAKTPDSIFPSTCCAT